MNTPVPPRLSLRQRLGFWMLCTWVMPVWLGRIAFWLARD